MRNTRWQRFKNWAQNTFEEALCLVLIIFVLAVLGGGR